MKNILATSAGPKRGIGITLTTGDHEDNVRMRGVVERHLDRFAFREAPLTYTWTEQ